MNFENMSAVLGEVSRLLMRAELSLDPIERATAIRRLKLIGEMLDAKLRVTETTVLAGATSRKVEAAAIRAALTTLAGELNTFAQAESQRSRRALQPAASELFLRSRIATS